MPNGKHSGGDRLSNGWNFNFDIHAILDFKGLLDKGGLLFFVLSGRPGGGAGALFSASIADERSNETRYARSYEIPSTHVLGLLLTPDVPLGAGVALG
jgi:hypothetical protein